MPKLCGDMCCCNVTKDDKNPPSCFYFSNSGAVFFYSHSLSLSFSISRSTVFFCALKTLSTSWYAHTHSFGCYWIRLMLMLSKKSFVSDCNSLSISCRRWLIQPFMFAIMSQKRQYVNEKTRGKKSSKTTSESKGSNSNKQQSCNFLSYICLLFVNGFSCVFFFFRSVLNIDWYTLWRFAINQFTSIL